MRGRAAVVIVLILTACAGDDERLGTARAENVLDGLTVVMTGPAEIPSGADLATRVLVENRSGHDVISPECRIALGPWAIVAADEPDAELWIQATVDCSQPPPYVYPAGYSEEYDGPLFVAANEFGVGLPPGHYVAAVILVDGQRIEYPITVT